jgi:hypothetical protein
MHDNSKAKKKGRAGGCSRGPSSTHSRKPQHGSPRDYNSEGDVTQPEAADTCNLRKQLRDAGFMPIPVVGKVPPISRWQKKLKTDDDEIEQWKAFPSTGLLTQEMPTFDIDIKLPEAAAAVEDLVRKRFSGLGTILVRFGNAPKRAIPFKTPKPFKKITANLIAPDGSEGQKLELLAEGQQVVAFGIHEDTHKPYIWVGGEPGEIKRDELPAISAAQARQLVNDANELLVREYGYTLKEEEKPEPSNTKRHNNYPPVSKEQVEAALNVISADCDDLTWAKIARCVHAALGEDGWPLFHAWSKAGKTKYKDKRDCRKKWKSAPKGLDQINVGTLFHLAKTAGNKGAQVGETVCAADVKPKALDWLWRGHLLRGTLELLTGVPGVGKSQVQINLVACVTAGLPWPDGAKGMTPANVIMLTAEDGLDQTVVPRLIAAKADLNRVHFLKCIKTDKQNRQFLLGEDLEALEKIINRIGDVALVTIDPITAYMGGKIDSHKTTEVRSQLGPLKDFSERMNVAICAITHPPKSSSARAIDHFIGSQAFIAAGRIGHVCLREVGDDGEPTGRMLFSNAKYTNTPAMPTLAYRIVEAHVGMDNYTPITAARVEWEKDPVDITADEAVHAAKGSDKHRGKQDAVQTFLREILKSGEPVPAKDVIAAAKPHGFTEQQLKDARKPLRVHSERGRAGWWWQLRKIEGHY